MKLAALIIAMLVLGLTACQKAPDDCKGEPTLNCICPHVYDPVCGCDGVTYGNACEANCAGVKLYKEGACGLAKDKGLTAVSLCKGKPKPNCYCPQVYDPVCGCDGVTYGNACEANCAGVRSYTEGACGVDNTKSLTSASDCKGKPILICACPHVYDPVCGCDGVTYSNACFATCAGVKSYKEGSCDGSGIFNR